MNDSSNLSPKDVEYLNHLAIGAGAAIMQIYQEPIEADQKADGSPVTKADAAGEQIIVKGLGERFPDVPIVAEELVEAGHLPPVLDMYFLVDPLDGTKEFLKRNGEFTVNIALVADGVPVFGVVYAPALGEIYWGETTTSDDASAGQAWFGTVVDGEITDAKPISVRIAPEHGLSVLASRSHLSEETSALIERLNVSERLSVGSSLKLCWVAAGRADVYPRLAPTMQWDIAAGDAVVRAAGGAVVYAETRKPFAYRIPKGAVKDDLRNPHFIAVSDPGLLPDLEPAC